eukprot:COSAG02_NODE_35825_length_462_cov_6.644628_1_plen_71_part_10
MPPKDGVLASDGVGSSSEQGRLLRLGVAERPSLRSRGRTLCPAPAPSEGGAADRSEELSRRCFAAQHEQPL